MSDERREEMRRYREQAIVREQQLHDQRQQQCNSKTGSRPPSCSHRNRRNTNQPDDAAATSRPHADRPRAVQNAVIVPKIGKPLAMPHFEDDFLKVSSLMQDQQQRFALVTSMVAACQLSSDETATTLGNVSDLPLDLEADGDDGEVDDVEEIIEDDDGDVAVDDDNDNEDDDAEDVDDDADEDDEEEDTDTYDNGDVESQRAAETNNGNESADDESSSIHTCTFVHNVLAAKIGAVDTDLDEPEQQLALESDPAELVLASPVDDDDHHGYDESNDATMRPRLIRSNSYTLEVPSPAFVKHMRTHGVDVNNAAAAAADDRPRASAPVQTPTTPIADEIAAVAVNAQPPPCSSRSAAAPAAQKDGLPTAIATSRRPPDVLTVRRKSSDAIEHKTSTEKRQRTTSTVAGGKVASKTTAKAPAVQTTAAAAVTARRPAFERVYGAKVQVVNVSLATPNAIAAAKNRKGTTATGPKVGFLYVFTFNINLVSFTKLNGYVFPQASATSAQQQRARRLYDPKSSSQRPTNHNQTTVTATGRSQPETQTVVESVAPEPAPTTPTTTAAAAAEHAHLIELIAKMDADRRRQMDELIERQQFEQRRLQEVFMQQQERIVQHITVNFSDMLDACQRNVTAQLANAVNTKGNIATAADVENNNNILTTVASSRRSTAELNNNDIPISTRGTDSESTVGREPLEPRRLFERSLAARSSTSMLTTSSSRNRIQPMAPSAAETQAATCINAHVRGYLTRRLFRTEDVQTVVQVIRDTLLFVMDLYREQVLTAGGTDAHHQQPRVMSEADAKLKRSLLKQLNASCYMLHDIFIGKPTADRMEIIATDRRIVHARRLKEAAGAPVTPVFQSVHQRQKRLSKLATVTL